MKLTTAAPSGSNCSCVSALDHRNKFRAQPAAFLCPATMCVDRTEVGAHVQKEGDGGTTTYIIPVCKNHASQIGQTITVNDYIPLVSTDVAETCAKPQQ